MTFKLQIVCITVGKVLDLRGTAKHQWSLKQNKKKKKKKSHLCPANPPLSLLTKQQTVASQLKVWEGYIRN